jgi:hypothetical protein
LLSGNGWRISSLISVNNVWEKGAPSIMGHARSIVERGVAITSGKESEVASSKWADVVRLAIVIPGNNLDKFRGNFNHLLPSIVPEIVASP